MLSRQRALEDQKRRKREADKAISERDAAVADIQRAKRRMRELEAIRASKHAVKSFTLESLGGGSNNAGGAKGRKNRHEVLDRLALLNVGLSAGQKNDWPWFKDAWDQENLVVVDKRIETRVYKKKNQNLSDRSQEKVSMDVTNEFRDHEN